MGLLDQTQEEYYLGPDGVWNSNDEEYGNYQFVPINDIINNFMIMYVGEDKVISKVKRTDVQFHAMRAIQEFSFDLLPQDKAIEIEVPPGLYMILPQDYVNYTKISWTDNQGIERPIYRTDITSNPSPYIQDEQYEYTFDSDGKVPLANESETLKRWDRSRNSANTPLPPNGSWTWNNNPDLIGMYAYGRRYGLTPEMAQANGTFYIDKIKGVIRFSSDLRERIVTLRYISDGLGTDADMTVHKFAVDAIYKYIAHAVLASKANTQEYLIARYKHELTAAKRNAKIRLSNLKASLMNQLMKNQSKWIKH
jgi:hypothetical protein